MMKKCLLILQLLLSFSLMARSVPPKKIMDNFPPGTLITMGRAREIPGMTEDIRRAREIGFDVSYLEEETDISAVAMSLHSFILNP